MKTPKIPYAQPCKPDDWFLNQINQVLEAHDITPLKSLPVWDGQDANYFQEEFEDLGEPWQSKLQIKRTHGWLPSNQFKEVPDPFVESDLTLFMLVTDQVIPNPILDALLIRCRDFKWIDAHMDWHDVSPLIRDESGQYVLDPTHIGEGCYPIGADLKPEESCIHFSKWGFIGDNPDYPDMPDTKGYYLVWRNCYCS